MSLLPLPKTKRTPLIHNSNRVILLLLIVFLITSCNTRQPIKIGISLKLNGSGGEIGVDMRNGAALAVEHINANGGINGRPIELIITNDEGAPETIRQADAELLEQDVVAILGHITSAHTSAAIDQMNEAKTVLFSPISTSDLFSGKDDFFFRSTPSTKDYGSNIARYIYETKGPVKISGIYDITNSEFTTPLWQAFAEEFTSLGGELGNTYEYTSDQGEIKDLMRQVSQDDAQGTLFIVAPIDMALMAQHGRQLGIETDFYTSLWAHSPELFHKGGKAIDGLTIFSTYNVEKNTPEYQEFYEQFQERFGYPPELFSISGYEAVLILAQALEKTNGNAEGLKEALTEIGTFESMIGVVKLDSYGDATRDLYVEVIRNRQYEQEAIISP